MAREADLGRGSGPPRTPAVRPTAEVQPKRGGFFGFIGESIAELRKVEWPSQNQVIQGTIVVLIACVIMGTFIWLADIAFKHLVQDLLLR